MQEIALTNTIITDALCACVKLVEALDGLAFCNHPLVSALRIKPIPCGAAGCVEIEIGKAGRLVNILERFQRDLVL